VIFAITNHQTEITNHKSRLPRLCIACIECVPPAASCQGCARLQDAGCGHHDPVPRIGGRAAARL